ncbi:MAG: hypothetical protein ABJP34_03665 [Erythrobacter sp.]
MTKTYTALACAIAAMSAPAMAEEKPVDAKPAAAQSSVFADVKPVEETKLAKIAGREDLTQLTNSDQANSVEANSVGDNSRTGTVQFRDNAFNNMTGITIVNANTGNNVAINAAVQVNIALPSQ